MEHRARILFAAQSDAEAQNIIKDVEALGYEIVDVAEAKQIGGTADGGRTQTAASPTPQRLRAGRSRGPRVIAVVIRAGVSLHMR